jgi:hypothetical protein
LPRDCVVNWNWLVTVPKVDLMERIGDAGKEPIRQGETRETALRRVSAQRTQTRDFPGFPSSTVGLDTKH